MRNFLLTIMVMQYDDFEDEPCDNDDNQFVYGCTFVTQHPYPTWTVLYKEL